MLHSQWQSALLAVVAAAFPLVACSCAWHACSSAMHLHALQSGTFGSWCERDPQRAKIVPRVLKLRRGWNAAAECCASRCSAKGFLCRRWPCSDFEETAGEHKAVRVTHSCAVQLRKTCKTNSAHAISRVKLVLASQHKGLECFLQLAYGCLSLPVMLVPAGS